MRSRARLLNENPLLDPERAIRLARDAQAFFDTPDDGEHELTTLAVMTAMDAAHLALETAIDTGDPHVLAAALDVATKRPIGWGIDHYEYEITSAAAAIFPALTKITNRVRDCARSRSSSLRAETAKGLGPRALRSLRGESPEGEAEVDAEAAGIVFALTKDENAEVRAAAREALGGAAPPAWAAFFPRDPLASLPAAEAARLRGPLDRAAEALEEGRAMDAEALTEAIAALPDELAAPILDSWMRADRITLAIDPKFSDALTDRWLSLDPDGERTLAWLRSLEGEGEHMDIEAGTRVGRVLKRQPAERVCAICLRVAEHLLDGDPFLKWNSEQLLETAWPDEGDPTPLLELVLGAPLEEAAASPAKEERDGDTAILKVALAARPAFEVLIEPLVDAFLAGFPGRWAKFRFWISERLIDASHPRLRAHAETTLREGEGAALGWALRHLTKGGHDPSIDPPVEEFLLGASRDPRLRAVISRSLHLRPLAQAALRAQLVTGELPPEEAIAVAKEAYDPKDESSLSADEWAVVRRAREAVEDPHGRTAALDVLPPIARWTREDWAFVESLIDDHGHDTRVAVGVVLSLQPPLRGAPQPEVVPLLERLLARSSSEAAEFVKESLEAARGEGR